MEFLLWHPQQTHTGDKNIGEGTSAGKDWPVSTAQHTPWYSKLLGWLTVLR